MTLIGKNKILAEFCDIHLSVMTEFVPVRCTNLTFSAAKTAVSCQSKTNRLIERRFSIDRFLYEFINIALY